MRQRAPQADADADAGVASPSSAAKPPAAVPPGTPSAPFLTTLQLVALAIVLVGTALAQLLHVNPEAVATFSRVLLLARSPSDVHARTLADAADERGVVTRDQLAAHDGIAHPDKPLWLALLGRTCRQCSCSPRHASRTPYNSRAEA